MSCASSTSPIDINKSNIAGNCDLKCEYQFNYNNSSCVVTHRGKYLSIAYDKSSTPPVQYNSRGYTVNEIRIYTPSIHSINGNKTDAEIVISHTTNSGANPLLVCVPVRASTSSSASGDILDLIVDDVRANAPTDGEITTVRLDKFNLNSIVPRKPFFNYTATLPYHPCNGKNDIIVFGDNASFAIIGEIALGKLRALITENKYKTKSGSTSKLYYNPTGARESSDDSIYIDCQPVGQSTKMVAPPPASSDSAKVNAAAFFNNPITQLILGVIGFLLIIYGLNILITTVQSNQGGGGNTMMIPLLVAASTINRPKKLKK